MITYMFSGECQNSVKQAFIDAYLPKLKLVVETTADYKKSGIYLAERDNISKPVVIDWGDGTVEQVNGDVSQKVHEYTSVGTFNVVVDNIKSYVASISKYTWNETTSQNAFTLKEVVAIPDSVMSINEYAFYDCGGLTSVTIGNGVTSIGNNAFDNCVSLTSITIGNSVTSIGVYAFYNCNSLRSVIIPDSVTSIGTDAFNNCVSLTSITIGNSVTSIGDEAFLGCSGLTSLIIPNSVMEIWVRAFQNCSSLTSVVFEGKTLAEVQAMDNYPWGIIDTSIITVI